MTSLAVRGSQADLRIDEMRRSASGSPTENPSETGSVLGAGPP
jgi:hypothetical protein